MTPEQKERQKERFNRWIQNPDNYAKYRANIKRAGSKPEALEKRRLKRHGITKEMYDTLWNKQGQCCGICGVSEKSHEKNWHIDHCHTTDQIRGILCHHCNLLLGNAKDNPVILEAAIRYLDV